MTFGFDADLFAQELELASSSSKNNNNSGGGGAKKPRQHYLEHPGIKFAVNNGPQGGLNYSKPNKKGVMVPKTAIQVRAIVLDSVFLMQQWGKPDGKAKVVCSSIGHTKPDGSAGNGLWQIPVGREKLVNNLNPQGFKGMSCGDCIAANENEGCKQTGAIYIVVTGLDHGDVDENDDFIGMVDCEPFVAHISTSGMSAFQYANFLFQVNKARSNPTEVEAIFSSQENPKAPVKMLKVDIGDHYSTPDVAKRILEVELKRIEEKRAKDFEAWKAKNPPKGGSGGSAAGDDEIPF
jgi:hypothetical protein